MIKLVIPGKPVAKARARITKWGSYTPEKTVNYETLIKELYIINHPGVRLSGMLELDMEAYFPIPKATSKKNRLLMLSGGIRPTVKPDIENIYKIIADALNGLAYDDDKQIVSGSMDKYYSEDPRVEIYVRELV